MPPSTHLLGTRHDDLGDDARPPLRFVGVLEAFFLWRVSWDAPFHLRVVAVPFAFLSQYKKDKYFLIALFFVSELILGPSVRVLGHDTMPLPPFAARHSHTQPFCRACQFLGVVGDVTPTGLRSLC